MDAHRWQRLSPLLDALLELEPEARAQSLASLREEDPAVAADLEELLHLEQDSDFLAEPLVTPMAGLRPGDALGPYRIERMLGEGGMGQVWLAQRDDGLYQRRVALKLLRPGLADPNLRLRFTRERQILARLEHPHIARLLDAGISGDGQPYLALEYVEGEPITDWCRAHEIDLDARLRLFQQVCRALSHAHANLIVHRDLKPSNILVTPLGEVRLLDFGIAKLLDTPDIGPEQTGTGVRAFTLHYAAPEQLRGEPVTTMTDVYALGMVLYELLADARPYQLRRQSDAEWEEAILHADPLRPSLALQRGADAEDDREQVQALRRRARDVAGDLDNIALKTLAKLPEQRYASVEALAQDVQRFREGKPVLARPQRIGYRVGKYVNRHRWALATGALTAVVLAAALWIVAWQARNAVAQASRAQALQDFIVGLIEQAGNSSATGQLDLRSLLDTGVQRVDRELVRQPVSRAELYGVIAQLRAGIGDYPQALALLQRQSRLIAELTAPPPALLLDSASDTGRLHRVLDAPQSCVDVMAPREALARQQQEQLPSQSAKFFSQLGRCRRALGQPAVARSLFQRSLDLRRDGLRDEAGVAENMADLANLETDAGNTAGAQRGYEQALAHLRGKVGARHPLAIDLQRVLCVIERNNGRVDAAMRYCRDALALALELRGPQDPASIDARRQLAAIHVDQGRFAEAEAAFSQSRVWLISRLGPNHPDVARDDNSIGIIAWERDQPRQALASLDHAIAILRRAPGSSLLSGVLFNKAMILHEVGSDTLALELLQDVRSLRSDQVGSRHPLVGETDRLRGEVLASLGRRQEAEAALRSAAELTRAGYGSRHPRAQRAALSLARFDARRGGDEALARIEAIAAIPGDDAESAKLRWRARAYAAEVRCGSGDRVAGRAALALLQADMRAALPEGGEISREVQAIVDACRGQGRQR